MLRFGLQNLKFRKIAFIYYSFVSMFSAPSRLIQDDSTLKFLLICLSIGILITIITLPMLWVVCLLNQKFDLGHQNILYPLFLIALVGAVRGGILQQLIAGLGLDDNLKPFFAVLSSTIFTLIYFTVISTFMEIALSRRDKFNQVFAEASLLLANPHSVINEKMDAHRVYVETLAGIRKSISSITLGAEKPRSNELLAASKEIKAQINEVLRPLSHRLWVNAMGQVKHRHLPAMLRDATENLDFSVKYILAYQFFVGGYGIALVIGLKSSLYVSTIGVFTSALLIKSYFYLRNQLRNRLFLLGIVFLVLEGLLPVFIPIASRNQLNESASAFAGILISPTLPGLILLVSAYRMIIRDRDFAIGAATSVGYRVAALTGQEQLSKNGIELAEYFHNSLQSELFGISKRLEAASQGTGETDTSEVWQSLDSALSRDYTEINQNQMGGLMRIEKLIASWKGIADIEVTGMDNLAVNSGVAQRTAQILEEMITNTIRYGEANSIEIDLVRGVSSLEIELAHNGKGEISKKSGLGSLMLAQHSLSGIQIRTQAGRTYLHTSLPLD